MSELPSCDPEIFKNGHAICAFHARAVATEEWVKKVAAASGQRVDWHYSGGIANVLFIGDYTKVRAAVEKYLPDLKKIHAEVFRLFEPESRGLYRAGDLVPDGVIGGSST